MPPRCPGIQEPQHLRQPWRRRWAEGAGSRLQRANSHTLLTCMSDHPFWISSRSSSRLAFPLCAHGSPSPPDTRHTAAQVLSLRTFSTFHSLGGHWKWPMFDPREFSTLWYLPKGTKLPGAIEICFHDQFTHPGLVLHRASVRTACFSPSITVCQGGVGREKLNSFVFFFAVGKVPPSDSISKPHTNCPTQQLLFSIMHNF